MSQRPARRTVPEVDAVADTPTYRELIERLRHRIRDSQTRAARTLNTELVMLYWSIGSDILVQQQAGGWGDDIVGRIAQDLAADTGSTRGCRQRANAVGAARARIVEGSVGLRGAMHWVGDGVEDRCRGAGGLFWRSVGPRPRWRA